MSLILNSLAPVRRRRPPGCALRGTSPVFAGGPQRRGFTTVEFVTAMVIALIISTLAMGSYKLYDQELPVKHTARRMAHAFSAARALAISQTQPYGVMIDRRYKSFWVDQVSTTGATTIPKVIQPEPIDDKVDIIDIKFGLTPVSASAGDPVVVRFYPDGSSEDARVILREAGPGAVYTVRNYGPTGQAEVFANQDLETTTGPS